jgi:protein tyrosine phosphatase (PTP) superfamily phosphohydrolase (DUF442 family)
MTLTDIYNYIPISDSIATSGQPTEEQLAEIAAAGFEAVINLALATSTNALADEGASVLALGMVYHHIPVVWEAPKVADFEQFCAVMDALSGKKVFIHCVANWRVSTFAAMYAEKRWGWSRAQADAHIRKMWEPDENWKPVIEQIRG